MYPLRTRVRGLDNAAVGSPTGRGMATIGEPPPVRTPEAGFLSSAAGISCTISRTNDVATGSATAHGLAVGDTAFIAGAAQLAYNGPQRVLTVADANTFTFESLGSPTSPATGTITVKKSIS